jgi:(R,R)-butanediol dehydrogenase / meso-butanediol dehydrogenase / diacetyl reductase
MMRAIRIHGRNDVRLDEVPIPALNPGQVLLRITAAGICGTDSALARFGEAVVPAGTPAQWPVVLGHEFAGEILEVGPGVDTLSQGDLVACGAGISCGECRQCATGRTNLCERYATAGVHRDGGLAEYCAVPAAICEPVAPHGVSCDTAAMAQPMAVAEHAIDAGRLTAGERALVIGAGGIGSFATWAASSRGAEITVYDLDVGRLSIAESLGAARSVAAEPETPAIDVLLPEGPFDVVYEMTGAQGPLDAAVASTRPGGRLVVVGIHGGPRTADLDRITLQEIEVHGTLAHVCSVNLPRALDLLGSREAPWSDVAPSAHPLEGLVEAGAGELARPATPDAPAPIKTLIDPWASAVRPFQ